MIKKLKEVCDFYTGTGFPIKYQGKTEGIFPFYKVGDIANNVMSGNIYLSHCNNYISLDDVKEIKGTIIPEGVVVFAKIGEALKLNRRVITTRKCLIDNNAMGIGAKPEYLDSKFFYYYMKKLKMETYAESTTVPSVRKSRLEELLIDIPSFEKQKLIVNILSKIHNIINNRRIQLLKFEELIKARFVEMFGIPGNDEKGWGKQPLGQCCEVNPKKSEDTRLFDELEVSFIPMGAVSDKGEIDSSSVRKYSEVKSGFTYFSENDVLFAKITPCMENGKGAIAKDLCNGIGFGTTEFHVLRPLDKLSNPYWLYTLTSFDKFRNEAACNMTGSAGQRRVPANFLFNYSVSLPPFSLQCAFADFVKQIDKSKVAVQKALDEAQLLFDSLMQEYFG